MPLAPRARSAETSSVGVTESLIAGAFDESAALHTAWARTHGAELERAAVVIGAALANGGQVLSFGNGGSATDAQHLAGELVGRFLKERRALAAVALTADSAILTCLGNDYGFETVFARQVEALGRRGDVAVGITTSGASANVTRALIAAKDRGMTTIALTGKDGGETGRVADVHLNVPSPSTPRVQEVHRTILHVLCELIEKDL
jgi:D-sedoheptulose 7-phosphate isomerase